MKKQIKQVPPLDRISKMRYFNYIINRFVNTLIKTSNGSVKVDPKIFFQNDVFIRLVVDQQLTVEKVINLPQFSLEVIQVLLEYLYKGDSRYYNEIETEVKRAIKFFKPMETDFDMYKTDGVNKKKDILQSESISQSVTSQLKNNTKFKPIQNNSEISITRTEPVNKVKQVSSIIIIISDSDESESPVKNVQTTQITKRTKKDVSSKLQNNTKYKPTQNISDISVKTTQPVNLDNPNQHNKKRSREDCDNDFVIRRKRFCSQYKQKCSKKRTCSLSPESSPEFCSTMLPVSSQQSDVVLRSKIPSSSSQIFNTHLISKQNATKLPIAHFISPESSPEFCSTMLPILNQQTSSVLSSELFETALSKPNAVVLPKKLPITHSISTDSSPEFCSTILTVLNQTNVSSSISSSELFETALSKPNAVVLPKKLPITHSISTDSSPEFCSTILSVLNQQTNVDSSISSSELFETALSKPNAVVLPKKLPITHSISTDSSPEFCSTILPVLNQTNVSSSISSSELFETALSKPNAVVLPKKLPITHSISTDSSLEFCSTILPVLNQQTNVDSSISSSELFETALSKQNAVVLSKKLSAAHSISTDSSPEFCSTVLPVLNQQIDVASQITPQTTNMRIRSESSPELCSTSFSKLFQTDLLPVEMPTSSLQLLNSTSNEQNTILLPVKVPAPSQELLKTVSSEQNSVVPMTSLESLPPMKSTSQIPTSSKCLDKEKQANKSFYYNRVKRRVFWGRGKDDDDDKNDLLIIRTNSYYLLRDQVKSKKKSKVFKLKRKVKFK